ncbi:MAG: alpha-1,2-fucosyltransferase [Desulfovibrionaceae bacterium]|nr:alpha-1,2-fucosyltransferase [Desulfovibrionaceae bacterium]
MDAKIITVDIFGGLGNQMFQYAMGKALASRLGCGLLLNVAGLAGDPLRKYALDCFPIPDTVDLLTEKSGIRRLWKRFIPVSSSKIIKEPHFHYWDGIERIAAIGARLHGYWQSPLYFAGFEEQLRNIFTFASMPDAVRELANEMKRLNSVAMHVRRGDYLKPEVSAVHGEADICYYQKAYALIQSLCPENRLYIFSDDVREAKKLLGSWERACFIEGYTQEQDMFLMGLCSYHIIANSSFSWWGAWLAGPSSRQVIAPRAWFSPRHQRAKNTADLFPPSWILI